MSARLRTDRPSTRPAPRHEEVLIRIEERLAEARRAGLERTLRHYSGIDFSSNDYLGLASARHPSRTTPPGHEPDPRDAGHRPLARANTRGLRGSTGSRALSGHSEAWERLEAELAAWHDEVTGADGSSELSVLTFSSGYSANEGLLSTLLEAGDRVASDAFNHGSLIDGMRLSKAERFVYRHQDLEMLEATLASWAVPGRTTGRRYVVTESMFGMDGDVTDLPRLVAICERHGAHLIVDEAHATGCYGPEGQGLVAAHGLRDRVLASVHTCGKALASHGAYVVCPRPLRDLLIQSARHFIFTTALPEALAARTSAGVRACIERPELRERLHARALHLRHGLTALGLPVRDGATGYILPLMIGDEHRATRLAEALAADGYRVPAIRYPTVARGEARLRFSVRADHTDAQIDAVVAAVGRALS